MCSMSMDINPIDLIFTAVEKILSGFFESLPQILIAVIVFAVFLLVGRFVRAGITSLMKRTRMRSALIRLADNLIMIATWILAFAFAVTIVFPSVTPANMIAGLGLTSLAVGFAFKDVFENFLAGVFILARKKMRIGDVIECQEIFGRIEDIRIRETHVRDTDGELIIVPNAYLFQNPLEIQTDQTLKRQELVVGVDYDSDMRAVHEALQGALETCDTVSTSKETEVKCVGFGGSSIDFKLLWWTDSQPKAQRNSYDEVAFAVKDALDEADVTIPFPQSTLSFRPEAWPVKTAPDREGRDAEMSSES